MYENQEWLPVATLFGLIGCRVPQELKAKMFQTMAMFALSPEIASSMWHTLELAQVLNTQHHSHGCLVGGGVGVAGGGTAYRHHMIQEGSIEVCFLYMYAHVHIYAHVHTYMHMYSHVHMYMHMYAHVHMYYGTCGLGDLLKEC